jgi:nicotinamidase/pyrazinamidase
MRALLLIDIQNDFCPGGALAVPQGDAVVAVANRLLASGLPAIATQDWHPQDHGSFAANHPGAQPFTTTQLAGLAQVLWPVHCVQGTPGAAFHPQLDQGRIIAIFPKGEDPTIDSYSGFFDNGRRRATGLDSYLRRHGFHELLILGLATDYCVKATVLDALALGYAVQLVVDGCRSVELAPGDGARACAAMRAAGARETTSAEVLARG